MGFLYDIRVTASSVIKIEFDIESFRREVAVICIDDVPLTEAIMIWCDENAVDIQIITSVIKKNPELKAAVEEDGRKRNLLKR